MSVKKKTGIILLTAAAMVFSGGCGKALVFDNEPQDTTGGNIISGIPLTESKVKPARTDRLAYYGRSNKKENRNLTEGKFIRR